MIDAEGDCIIRGQVFRGADLFGFCEENNKADENGRDAFSENVAECLDAGMNGHIAKPIDIKLVLREIKRIREEKNK